MVRLPSGTSAVKSRIAGAQHLVRSGQINRVGGAALRDEFEQWLVGQFPENKFVGCGGKNGPVAADDIEIFRSELWFVRYLPAAGEITP
jgi:hypothetical protein